MYVEVPSTGQERDRGFCRPEDQKGANMSYIRPVAIDSTQLRCDGRWTRMAYTL